MEKQHNLYIEADTTLVHYLELEHSFKLSDTPINAYSERLKLKGVFKSVKPIEEANIILKLLQKNFNILFVVPEFIKEGVTYQEFIDWHTIHFTVISKFCFTNQGDTTALSVKITHINAINYNHFGGRTLDLVIDNPMLDWPYIIYKLSKIKYSAIQSNSPFTRDQSFVFTKSFLKAFPFKLFSNAIQDLKASQLQDLARDYSLLRFPEHHKILNNFQEYSSKKLKKQIKKHNTKRLALGLQPLVDINGFFNDKALKNYCYNQVK